jgi:hypothetical protein
MTRKRSVFRSNVIVGLRYLASYDYQKFGWFENDLGIGSSFADDVEDIFVRAALESALDAGDIVFDKETDEALKELNRACDAIGYDWAGREEEHLESEAMKHIRALARKCFHLVRNNDASESTVNLIDTDPFVPDLRFADMPD